MDLPTLSQREQNMHLHSGQSTSDIDCVSTSAPLDFSSLAFLDTPRTSALDFNYGSSVGSSSTREDAASSPDYSVVLHHSSTFIDAPVPQRHATFSSFSSHPLERRWTENDFGADIPEFTHFERVSTSPLSSEVSSSNMSTLALSYESAYGHMGPRSTYSWSSVPDSHAHLQDTPVIEQMPESHMNGSSRSETASPPRLLSPEQRALKKQQDHVRRETKNALRLKRANSQPYSISPPVTTDGMNMSMYQSSPGPVSMMSDAQRNMPSHQYVHHAYSPPSSEPLSAMTPTYPPTPMHYNMSSVGMDYSSSFSNSTYDQSGLPGLYTVPPVMPSMMPSSTIHSEDAHVRVLHTRPKPQCWDHGCNGRQFSTFSNLLRHQREKSGQAPKTVCPHCGQTFTRSTACRGHILQNKCRGRNEGGDNSDLSDTNEEQNMGANDEPQSATVMKFDAADYHRDQHGSSSPELGNSLPLDP